ncbi:MAG: GNAT family N-acetyltransferase [Solirubrobacteraceae bacterium]
MLHTLPDGTPILVRPIEAADKDRLSVALGHLSQETIRRRFLAAKPSFTTGELRYLTEVDGRNHLALAAFPAGEPETIVGVARCVRLPTASAGGLVTASLAPATAEFAIVVGDAHQGRGLGTLLARELATAARAAGIRRFAATMLRDNVAVRRLMATITAHLELDRMEGGLREVVVDLAA